VGRKLPYYILAGAANKHYLYLNQISAGNAWKISEKPEQEFIPSNKSSSTTAWVGHGISVMEI